MKTLLSNLNKNNSNCIKTLRKSLKQMRFKQFQLAFIDGLYESKTEIEVIIVTFFFVVVVVVVVVVVYALLIE